MGENFHKIHGYVAVRENIIREYCIAYKVWLKYKNAIHEIFILENMLMPLIREHSHPRNKPAIRYMVIHL